MSVTVILVSAVLVCVFSRFLQEIIEWTYGQPDDAIHKVEPKPDFSYTPVRVSFNKTKSSVCGEYVFERYVRMKDAQPVCIPCYIY